MSQNTSYKSKKNIAIAIIGIILISFLWIKINPSISNGRDYHRYCKMIEIKIVDGQKRALAKCTMPRLYGLLPNKVIFKNLEKDQEARILATDEEISRNQQK
ncbi:hypothetical protein ACTJJ0_22295 [Chitinophaga sp. 22321]|uniref:hypothetical protein n=1 Tax=Chitinophaga sp. 22321 TaxID=3453909 RepID=UPI003F8799C2